MQRIVYPERMRETTLDRFSKLDPEFYKHFSDYYASQQFQDLGDWEIITPGLSKIIARNTVYRCMVSADGVTMATGYEVGFTRFRRMILRLSGVNRSNLMELRMALSDGTVLIGLNVSLQEFQIQGFAASGITVFSYPDASCAELFAAYQQDVAKMAATELGSRRLLKLDSMELQRSIMDFEAENTTRAAKGLELLPIASYVNLGGKVELSRKPFGSLAQSTTKETAEPLEKNEITIHS
ncbi:MAG: hypothetical protein PHS41_02650 [Victivallaceae bacterium]|nr:hypothetical protein [Victivallaceae bacterium]